MTHEDYVLIDKVSNSKFPLIDFVKALSFLNREGKLQDFDYEAMQDDLVKIAKLFKYYRDEATKAKRRMKEDERNINRERKRSI